MHDGCYCDNAMRYSCYSKSMAKVIAKSDFGHDHED